MIVKLSRQAVFLATAAILAAAWDAVSAEPNWRKTPYSYSAQDASLRDLLMDFGSANGMRIVVSRRVTDRVSGRFEGMEPKRFIEKIGKAYGLTWYYDGATLYFYKFNEMRSRVLSLQYVGYGKLVSTLKDMGIWEERYPLRHSVDAMYVYGPPRYVEMVIETAARLDGKEMENSPTLSDGHMVRIFPLKHAWASDVVFAQSGKQMTVPGVSSLLNSIINKDALPLRPQWLQKEISQSVRGLSQRDDPSETLLNLVNPASGASNQKTRTGIFADARTNSVIIKDSKENLQRFQALVGALDVPVGLVEISATIIDFSNGSVRDLGVEWQHAGSGAVAGTPAQVLHGQTFSNLTGAEPGKPAVAPAPPELLEGYTFSTLVGRGASSVLARIRVLEKHGKAKINSRPGVLTFDNLQAHISHTQTFHVRVAGERDAQLFELESGTVLRVTPHIIEEEGEKSVRLVVEIEDGSVSSDQLVDNIPTVSKSAVNTQAVVGDEESLLLGGFIRTEESTSSSQVPLLGSIPLLGHLFKKSTRVRQRVERIFMITPRIIESAGEAGRLYDEDDKERRFQKSLVPDEKSSSPAWKSIEEVPVSPGNGTGNGSWTPR